MTREPLDRRVLDWIAEGVDAPADTLPDEERFDALALELYAYQYEYNEPYRRMCDAFERPPSRVARWSEIPAVPTGAFKTARLATFSPDQCVQTFRTSGSTAEARGSLHLDTMALYEASLRATFGAHMFPELPGEPAPRTLVLAPSPIDLPDSSLSYMFDVVIRDLAAAGSRFLHGHGGWDMAVALAVLERVREPVALCGTAFAFVHLMDALEAIDRKHALPSGSRVLETGGFKGRSRELTRAELHEGISRSLGVPRERIVNQYGMCELGSQFYEPTLRTGVPTTHKAIPPWVRTRAVDPATLADVGPGETGVLVHYDLANTGSVLAVMTSDAGTVDGQTLEVFGRVEGAEARGCSIAADALLSGT